MLLACLAGLVGNADAQPRVERTDLFDAGKGDYALYRIPGVVVATDGTVLAYCEARKTGQSDWGDIDILLRRSTDAGRTWSPARRIVEPPRDVLKNPAALKQKLGVGQVTANNPVAIAARDGTVHFLYCVEYSRCYYMRSGDGGQTFTSPVDLTPVFAGFRPEYDWIVLATGPGHGIQLKTGRLLVPVWLSTGAGGHAHRPSCNATIYSDDGGKTWQRGAIVAKDPQPANPSETVVAELSDGRVMLNFRHEGSQRRRAVTLSPDGAGQWSPVRFDEALPEPVCMASLLRLPVAAGAKPALLFANPHNPTGRERRNLTLKLSDDDGQTWPTAKVLEPGAAGYCDLAAGADGTIYCFFERGDEGSRQSTAHLTMARFTLDWLRRRE